jgi:hypothetical protein
MMKSEQQPMQFFDREASVGKLMFLALMAIALCAFVPMSVFAPIPLAIAFLLYGRLVAFALGAVSVGFLWSAGLTVQGFPTFIAGIYLIAFFYAFLVSEVIYRNVNPVRGLIFAGLVVVFFSGSFLIAFDKVSPVSLKAELSQSVSSMLAELKKQKQTSPDVSGDEERAFDEFVSKPEAVTNEIYSSLPMIVFITSYFGLWISLYVTLRNSLIWRTKVQYDYILKDFTHFKVPDFFVYPLILSLVLFVGADYGLPAGSEVVGRNLLYSLGVFYLFQGFGVYSDFLKFLKIGGFIKTLFIAFTLILAAKFLAILGIFDLWFDFRRFFTNLKKDKGDTI